LSAAPKRLLLLRHGLPDYRDHKAGDEWPGPSLSDIGRAQAAQAAAALQPLAPPLVLASPLTRTCQTAEIVASTLRIPLRVEPELREWHRTESLYEVTLRLTRWLVRWVRAGVPNTLIVSHASPILALLRSALYLPQATWWKMGHPGTLELSTADRFEVTMASIFELIVEPDWVTVRRRFHPTPQIHHIVDGRCFPRLPHTLAGTRERTELRRPNRLHLLG